MDTSSIKLPGSEIAEIRIDGDQVVVQFSRATLIKSMGGSKERTRWWQAGKLCFAGATVTEQPAAGPLVCSGGDVGENIYTYRDMIPIPLNSQGRAHCSLQFEGSDRRLQVEAESVELVMEDRPRYIEHIRP